MNYTFFLFDALSVQSKQMLQGTNTNEFKQMESHRELMVCTCVCAVCEVFFISLHMCIPLKVCKSVSVRVCECGSSAEFHPYMKNILCADLLKLIIFLFMRNSIY